MKGKKLLLIVPITFVLFAGCFKGKNNQWPQQNFLKTFEPENIWINADNVVSGDAHTGNYAAKLDGDHEFSYGLSARIGEINSAVPYKVIVSFWVKYPTAEDIGGEIVIRVNDALNNDKLYFQKSIRDKVSKPGVWEEVTAEVTLPNEITIDDKLSFYIWNIDKKNFLMDDLNIAMQ